MAGEIIKTDAICLRVSPWSRTSHVVSWLTTNGRITTLVKGAVRPKSLFLGQYDLNYTCEILYYARAKNDLYILRECAPLLLREELRRDYRALLVADYCRAQVARLAPMGDEAKKWFDLLSTALDQLATSEPHYLHILLTFECDALHLAGLSPDLESNEGFFHLRGERHIPISEKVLMCLRAPHREQPRETLIEALRAIGLFYSFHLETPLAPRRALLNLLIKNENRAHVSS